MFQISEHYLPYPEETIIVVASGERVRIFEAQGRDIHETKVLESEESSPNQEHIAFANNHEDNQERHARQALYKQLANYLGGLSIKNLIVCAPEAYQHEVIETLEETNTIQITHFIPKNLASLPLDALVRILQER